MNQETMIADIEARASALGVPVYVLCNKVGIAPSSYYRWKGGSDAKLANLVLLADELTERERKVAA